MTEKAYGYQVDKQQRDHERKLDELDDKLSRDRDPRTQGCLRELRLLYDRLQRAAEKGNINTSSFEIIKGVGKVFDECVKQLEHSHGLWETARQMRGPAKESMMVQRDGIIQEVVATVVDVGQMVERYLVNQSSKNRSELSKVRRELDESIEAARRAEARTADLERTARAEVAEQQ